MFAYVSEVLAKGNQDLGLSAMRATYLTVSQHLGRGQAAVAREALKRRGSTLDTKLMKDDRRPPDGSAAFGHVAARVPWWISKQARLSALLACLGLAVLGLAISSTNIFSGNNAVLASFPAGCPPAVAPVVNVRLGQLAQLRASLLPTIVPLGGRRYAAGIVTPDSMWSDDPPQKLILSRSASGGWPAAYEVRQWAGDGDDVAADVFLFAGPAQAHGFFDQASSASCHHAGIQPPTSQPPQARNLVWINPDGFSQADVFLVRGPRVYRIADVRPQHPGVQSIAVQRAGVSTVDALACAIPGARCNRTAALPAPDPRR
ncbi:MAG: hypothetical protein WAN93_14440 [Solirubrobacteraceae bacterium]